uniref:Serine/threonine-protein kinase haspin n=1 Tax=Chelonoidis abingdonii TaxID=106734 RepID=A0A8C0JDL3_CHEAB
AMERPTRPQPRLLRTYARRGASRYRLPRPAPWLSPPLDSKRLFSSSSASVGSTSTASSPGSEDPDFQPCLPRRAAPPPTPAVPPGPGGREEERRSETQERSGPRGRAPQSDAAASASRSRRHVTAGAAGGRPGPWGRRRGCGRGPPCSLDAWPSWSENDCQQPVSPSALSVISVKKSRSRKVIPRDGDGGTSRKACISGFNSSRWGKQARRRPFRHKNSKTLWQQAEGSFFQEQMRQRGIEKNAPDMSSSLCDSSFLNDSQWWARARASLTLHKKKKVSIEESACGSIPCTPSSKSQLAGYRKSPFIQSVGCCNWPTSSVLLLTPMKSHSVLEMMLTDAEKVYGECQQVGPISFDECIPPDKMKNCLKIGEGVFGEVFQTNSERGAVALKIIPVEGTERVNGEAQKSFSEILPEMIISKELSLLSQEVENRTVGFIDLYSVHCVQGSYPKHLLKAWDKYHELNGSENDRPDLFGEQQLFMVLEFEFGGNNLENMRKQLNSVATAKSLLHQVTASLAVAEEGLHFEHRDLHWGNILVKKTNLKELSYTLNGAVYTISTKGIHVNIIDYTLSRMEKDGLTVFCDISTDKELFQGRGDYQFDIYRQMKKENSNNWADYHPHSNVLWLHYLADKLLKEVNYKRKLSSSSALKGIQKQLRKFHSEVLNFSSASDILLNSSLFH